MSRGAGWIRASSGTSRTTAGSKADDEARQSATPPLLAPSAVANPDGASPVSGRDEAPPATRLRWERDTRYDAALPQQDLFGDWVVTLL